MPRPLVGAAEILAASGSDPLVRSQLRGARDTGPAWSKDGAVGWFAIDADERMRYFFVVGGTPATASRLVAGVAEQIFATLPTPRVSVPRAWSTVSGLGVSTSFSWSAARTTSASDDSRRSQMSSRWRGYRWRCQSIPRATTV
jgi:hypothetical protein